MLTKLTGHLAYYGRAALHTFWEAALGSLLVALGGSGLDFAHLPSLPVLEKIGGAAAIAGLAAIFTYVKQVIVLPAPGSVVAVEPSPIPDVTVDGPIIDTPDPGVVVDPPPTV